MSAPDVPEPKQPSKPDQPAKAERTEPLEPPQSPQDREHLKLIEAERRRRAVKLTILAAVVVLFAVFIVRNSQPAPVDFIVFERTPRLIWVMFACALIGGVVGYILGRPGKRLSFHRKQTQDQAKKKRAA